MSNVVYLNAWMMFVVTIVGALVGTWMWRKTSFEILSRNNDTLKQNAEAEKAARERIEREKAELEARLKSENERLVNRVVELEKEMYEVRREHRELMEFNFSVMQKNERLMMENAEIKRDLNQRIAASLEEKTPKKEGDKIGES